MDELTWFQFNTIPVDELSLYRLELLSKGLGHDNAVVTLSLLYVKQDLIDAHMDPKTIFA